MKQEPTLIMSAFLDVPAFKTLNPLKSQGYIRPNCIKSNMTNSLRVIFAQRILFCLLHGPNVSIGKYANIGEGVRVRESIVLEGATLQVTEGVRFQESIVLEGVTLQVAEGERVRESIVLEGAPLQDHSCVLYSIIGWNAVVGSWTRVDGTPNGSNPNKPFAKIEVTSTFTNDGNVNPSITVIGSNVQIPSEVVILSSIVLPDKSLSGSYKNQIILY